MFSILLIIILTIFATILIGALWVYVIQQELQIRIPTIQTNEKDLVSLIKQINVTSNDVIIDLGSGTGETLFTFEKYTQAKEIIGYEIGIIPYLISRIKKNLYKRRSIILRENFLYADLSQATIIYTYLSVWMLERLEPTLQKKLQKGATIICCDFALPNQRALKTIKLERHVFYMYQD